MHQASEELEQYLDDIVNLPYILYRNPDLFRVFEQGFDRSHYFNQLEIYKGMTTFYLMRSEIRQVRFYIDEGKSTFTVYNTLLSSRKLKPDFMKQISIQRLVNSEKNYLVEPPHRIENYNNTSNLPQSDKTVVLTVHHKIMDTLSNEFLGVITIDIDMSKIARITDHFLQKNKETVLLSEIIAIINKPRNIRLHVPSSCLAEKC